MLIGNKADLTAERAVKKDDGVQVAKVSNVIYNWLFTIAPISKAVVKAKRLIYYANHVNRRVVLR